MLGVPSDDLSRATGVVKPFVVLRAWEIGVGKGLSTETEIFKELEEFRLEANKEFFDIDYALLVEIIEGVVERVTTK